MRLAAVVGIIALGGLYGYVRMGHGEDDTFSERYLAMASTRPDELKRHFLAVIPECLPAAALKHMKTQRVEDLTAMTFMQSATLTAEGKNPEEASKALIPYLIKLGEQMPKSDQEAYLAVFKNGGMHPDTLVCVLSSLKGGLMNDVGGNAEKWQLRL